MRCAYLHVLYLIKIIYVFERPRELSLQRYFANTHSSCSWSWVGMKAGAKEPDPVLPHGWRGAKYWSHQLLLLKRYISAKLELEAELGFEFRHSDMGCGQQGSILTPRAKYLPSVGHRDLPKPQ